MSTVDRTRLASLMAAEHERFVKRTPRSAELHRQARRSLLAGVPMNWMTRWPGPHPVFVDDASGARFTDVDGNTYIDLCLGDTGAMTGHALPATVRAIEQQAPRGITTMLPSADAVAVGDELRSRFGLPVWQIAMTATDANRFAIRWARGITGRKVVLVFDGCYHGTVDDTFHWEWARKETTLEALEVIWNMTGRWNARRPVTVPRKAFDKCVGEVVPDLAAYLNRQGITCLRDLAELESRPYRAVIARIHRAVERISALRETQHVEPVLGSKVLHHYFPSIVPVFDTRFIRNGVMRTSAYRDSLDVCAEWRTFSTTDAAGGPSMFDFHGYFAFCAWQIGTASMSALTTTRTQFGRDFRRSAPVSMAANCSSVLWHMDAKIAEYCAVNHAHDEQE